MRKYLFIFKATLIESLQYIISIVIGFITFFIILFIFTNLWRYLYSDSSGLIDGYSLQQMVWYVILTETKWFGAKNRTLTSQVSNDIKGGTIAYSINKPYNYVFYIIAKHLGEIAIKFTMFFIIGMVIGFVFVGGIPDFKLYQLPFATISFLLGILINSFLVMGISVLSFWIEDSTPFHWIYDKMILIIGTIFPVELFPIWAQPIIRYSPIYVINYGPAKLMIDFSPFIAVKVLTAQVIYVVITFIILFALFQKGVKKLNVNGG